MTFSQNNGANGVSENGGIYTNGWFWIIRLGRREFLTSAIYVPEIVAGNVELQVIVVEYTTHVFV